MQYIKLLQANDSAWFNLEPADASGVIWRGRCWAFHNHLRYEFELRIEVRRVPSVWALETLLCVVNVRGGNVDNGCRSVSSTTLIHRPYIGMHPVPSVGACTGIVALQLPVSYPAAPPEIILPELDGLTPKMYQYVRQASIVRTEFVSSFVPKACWRTERCR